MLLGMARPIEPTPPLTGADADRLLEELEQVASPDEIARRREAARRFLTQVTGPKSPPPEPAPADPSRR
jgi:hypothetical protein